MGASEWFGPYAGTNSGNIIAEFDQVGLDLVGTVTAYPGDPMPPAFTAVTIPVDRQSFEAVLQLQPIDFATGNPVPWESIASRHPGLTMSRLAETKWALSTDNTLYVSWVTDIGNHGTAVLQQGAPNAPSAIKPLAIESWSEFKDYVTSLEPNRYIFRGHEENTWRLRTYFHRTRRADLRRFMRVDIPVLHRHLSGLTQHVFNLADPIENGAFHNLVQHHGYPTPLLDWTYSPFVAAYFAYRNIPKERRTAERKIRIVLFDARQWQSDFQQLDRFTPALRHFSILLPIAINNARMVPQQALLTISNVDDIEGYIAENEAARGKTYLEAIDLPASERPQIMSELRMMGITAGSLFPGIEGVCEQLREASFEL
jgi:hypothetical protein